VAGTLDRAVELAATRPRPAGRKEPVVLLSPPARPTTSTATSRSRRAFREPVMSSRAKSLTAALILRKPCGVTTNCA
jgi:hypothetical protein